MVDVLQQQWKLIVVDGENNDCKKLNHSDLR